MSVETMFTQIETLDFEANLVIASGPKHFQKMLDNHEDIQHLIHELRSNSANIEVLYEHLLDILKAELEPGFVHPNDLFIASYLYVLNKFEVKLAVKTAQHILDIPQLRWARRLARQVVEEYSAQSDFLPDDAGQSETTVTLSSMENVPSFTSESGSISLVVQLPSTTTAHIQYESSSESGAVQENDLERFESIRRVAS